MKILKGCKFIDNDQGFVHTLEAILGISIIIGVILFATASFPYMTQKTGEHSKVQLVNIGRDTLDIIELTPITNIFGNYSENAGVNRTYTLVANKTMVFPGESINFTVYYLDSDVLVTETLNLYRTNLGNDFDYKNRWTTITGYNVTNFLLPGEYSVIASNIPAKGNPPTMYSNAVTITVGTYFLDTDINGIFENGDKNISGKVYYPNMSGIPNLTIQLLDNDGKTLLVDFANRTSYGRIIEDFESIANWKYSSGSGLSLNTMRFTQGFSSLSISGPSSFWINKTNVSNYGLLEYDNLSFDFFANTGDEKIVIELSKNNTSNKFVYNNISAQNIGWNKIKFQLKNPDIILGDITTHDMKNMDTINISVSNINTDNYLFDNMTVDAGSFSVIWPDKDYKGGNINAGMYYIRAIDSNGYISNNHMIIYSGSNPGDKGNICCDSVIYETDSVNIMLFPESKSDDLSPINQFSINGDNYDNNYDKTKIVISGPINPPDNTVVTLTAFVAGDYYVVYHRDQGGGSSVPTNAILIRVLPLKTDCIFGDCKVKCAGLDMVELDTYMRIFIPYYINYNMYLISPDGRLCTECPEFQEIINGYPTDEAVTVSKILHIKTISGEGLRELRMTLWYK